MDHYKNVLQGILICELLAKEKKKEKKVKKKNKITSVICHPKLFHSHVVGLLCRSCLRCGVINSLKSDQRSAAKGSSIKY